MKTWIVAGLLLFTFLLQLSITPFLSLGGVKPDLVVLLVTVLGVVFGSSFGLGAGIVSGLVADIFFGRYIGIHALSLGILGYLAGLAEHQVYREQSLVQVTTAMVATAFHQLVFMILLIAVGPRLPLGAAIGRTIIPVALYNGVLGPFVFRAIFRLQQWSQKRTERAS
ncbi:MAG: rod shape-determining protein MreD [Bacillota bacterium]